MGLFYRLRAIFRAMGKTPKLPPWARTTVDFLVAFTSGFLYEACSVLWVHQATNGTPLRTAMWSGLQALMLLLGIGESVRDKRASLFFIVGYAMGAYEAMLHG